MKAVRESSAGYDFSVLLPIKEKITSFSIEMEALNGNIDNESCTWPKCHIWKCLRLIINDYL